jgi:hypothetical protein
MKPRPRAAKPPEPDPRIKLRPILWPQTVSRAYVEFSHAERGPGNTVELVFKLRHSTKYSRIVIRALSQEQAKRMHMGLEMVIA